MDRKEKISFILKETNPWWKQKTYSYNNYFPRQIFPQIQRFFELPQIIAMVGLRRTGKTTLMLKMIESFLKKLKNRNILYFSFDDFSSLDIEDILLVYSEIFADVDLKKERFLFCFDEVQKLENWQEKIKRLYDNYRNIKIILSGSESLFIRKKGKETLGGRIFEFDICPLTFKEYLSFTGKNDFLNNTQLYKREIIKQYWHYMKINGLPELVNIEDSLVIYKYLKESIIDKIIFRDIPELFGINNVNILSDILDVIIFYPGQIIDTVNLSNEMGISRQSISQYLGYLEKAFLVKKLYNFSKNMRKQKRSLKKYYPAIVFPDLVDSNFPFCFENSLVWQLDAQFFYRDKYQYEVDIIKANNTNDITPIEIKTGKIDIEGMKYFMKRYKLNKGIVLSVEKEGAENNIKIIPFYKYLLK